jgi:Anti-sigma-K factor rskA
VTSTPEDCATIAELAGVHALDALEPDEALSVSSHLEGCSRCAREYHRHRETISLLAAVGGTAPEALWERIAIAIEGDRGPEQIPRLHPMLLAGRPRPPKPAWTRIVAAAAVAAAVIVIGFQTARVDHLHRQVTRLNTAEKQSGPLPGLAAALVDPSAQHLTLIGSAAGRQPVGQLIILPSGASYLVGSRLGELPAGRIYQLWSVNSGRAISVGLLGAHPTTVAFNVDPAAPANAYLVTVEPSGGVVAPTSAPIARADA